MNNKRGLSDVITIVLFILLALAAVIILWGFIQNFFFGIDLDSSAFTNQFSIVEDSVLDNTGDKIIQFNIRRDSGKTELVKIIVTIIDDGGKAVTVDLIGGAIEFGTMDFTYNYTLDNLLEIEFVTITPVYLINGEEKNGGEADRYLLKDSDRVVWVVYDTGWKFPGIVESIDSMTGSYIWTNLDNVKNDDGVPSSVNLNSEKSSDYLRVSNFGFNLPDGSVIEGVKVEVNRWAISQPNKDSEVNLIVGGLIEGDNKYINGEWLLDKDTIVNYGGEGDLWGVDFGVSDIEKEDFGFSLSILVPGYLSPRAGAVDYIKMKVYYRVLEQAS